MARSDNPTNKKHKPVHKGRKSRKSQKQRAQTTRGADGDPEAGAQCVPLALTYLAGEKFTYEDFKEILNENIQSEEEPTYGFNWADCMDVVKAMMPDALFYRMVGYQNDPKKCLQKLLEEKKKGLKTHKFLLFGLLKDDRPMSVKKEIKLPLNTWWHCAAIDLDKTRPYWCAYHLYQQLDEGFGKFRSIQAMIGFERRTT